MSDNSTWITRFPGLSRMDPELRDILVARSRVLSVPAGTMIFGPGKSPEHMLFLLSGLVRVQQVSETGHEIVLYRIHAGESCVLTTACLLALEDYSAEGIAETDIEAVAVPRAVFDELVAQSRSFRDFVFAAFSKRITGLFRMIDEVAFQKLDVRMAEKLLDLSNGTDALETTHQKLSVELGTAREVVSRQLQEFQRRGWIEQGRGHIRLKARDKLRHLADHHG